ncbi:MAG: hypothetical protein QXF14_00315, partial [Candidatus Woesearchaeota archaeon]
DFNHPLAGKDVVYDVKINRIVTDKKEQLKAVFAMLLNISPEKMELENSRAKVLLKQELPKEILPELQKKIKELTGIDAEISVVPKEKLGEKKHEENNSPEKRQDSKTKQGNKSTPTQ